MGSRGQGREGGSRVPSHPCPWTPDNLTPNTAFSNFCPVWGCHSPRVTLANEYRVLPLEAPAPQPPCSAPRSQAPGTAPGKSTSLGIRRTRSKSRALQPWPGRFIYRNLNFLICKVGVIIAPVTWDCLFPRNNK